MHQMKAAASSSGRTTAVRRSRTADRLQRAHLYGWLTGRWLRARIRSWAPAAGGQRAAYSFGRDAGPDPGALLTTLTTDSAFGMHDYAPGWRHFVVVGDSLGLGVGQRVPGLELVGAADRLATALRTLRPAMRYTNLAVSGHTTRQIAGTQLPTALALRPDLVLLVAGGSDLLGLRWDPIAFRDAYAPLLGQLMATGARVLTTTWHNLPQAVPMPARLAEGFSRRLAEASAIVLEASAQHGATCVDLWPMPDLLNAHCYSSDGIHPNARGYLRVAHVMAQALAHLAGVARLTTALYTPGERAARAVHAPARAAA
jgi:lysophospholipase L1-like esterase